ncbi:hypothetical protein [Aeromonas caviae]|uniref:hypothetical protein n=1 Tax=Aeromonas caviae TaxID=648 RepID=UPI002B49D28F|nr:hypothetical protein [Aeromonas caviae]
MTINLPSTHFYTLASLDIKLQNEIIEYNNALLNTLSSKTLSAIKNAFSRRILVWQNGLCYVKVSELNNLLRTGSSGAENYYWQQGISGYSSPSSPHELGGDIYISGPDFFGLLDARIQLTAGKTHLYLKYVRALYISITSSSIISDLRTSFSININNQRGELKEQRISYYNIQQCEFTNNIFTNNSQVQFAHIESVTTAPLLALNIDNGVIIFKHIHADLTRLGIHDFAGMYDYCIQNNYSTVWAEKYNL